MFGGGVCVVGRKFWYVWLGGSFGMLAWSYGPMGAEVRVCFVIVLLQHSFNCGYGYGQWVGGTLQ